MQFEVCCFSGSRVGIGQEEILCIDTSPRLVPASMINWLCSRRLPCDSQIGTIKLQYLDGIVLLKEKRRHRQQLVLDPLAQADFSTTTYSSVSDVTWALHLRSLSLSLMLGNTAASLLWGVWSNWVFPKCFEILCKAVLLQEP